METLKVLGGGMECGRALECGRCVEGACTGRDGRGALYRDRHALESNADEKPFSACNVAARIALRAISEMGDEARVFGELVVSADGELDAQWLSRVVGLPVSRATIRNFAEKIGGFCGQFHLVDLYCDGSDAPRTTLVLKTTLQQWQERDLALGTPREGLFLAEFGSRMPPGILPRVYYGYGDMATGLKAALMEKLPGAVPAGVMYDRTNPNNDELREKLDELRRGLPDSVEITKQVFSIYARLHAQFWRDESLLAFEWLKGTSWLRGDSESTWKVSQQMVVDIWSRVRPGGTAPVPLEWDPHTVACIEESIRKISWPSFQAELRRRSWTLIHGDAHPHNVMIVKPADGVIDWRLVDFEMAGTASPGQDLGQFLISHMTIDNRRAHERQLIEHYHTELLKCLLERGRKEVADSYTLEQCWREYIEGGAGRWLWFLPGCAEIFSSNLSSAQYFHDHVGAFLQDHYPDASSVCMPRA